MDDDLAELHGLLRGGPHRVRGVLLGTDGGPLHQPQPLSLLAAGFGITALAAFPEATRVTAVRLTADIPQPAEPGEEPDVATLSADVPLATPVDVPAGVPVFGVLPDAPDLSPAFVPGQPVEETPPAGQAVGEPSPVQAEAPRAARPRRGAAEPPQTEPAPVPPGDPAPQP